MPRRVLVVDDEKGVREALRQLLEYEQIEVHTVTSGQDALDVYPEFSPHLVFLDVKMAGMDGLETLAKLRQLDGDAQIVMISGHGTIQTAVEATQLGAYDFLEKPLDTDRVLVTLRNALEHVELESENQRLRAGIADRYEIVGQGSAITRVLATIEKVAPTASRVLIAGENGSGKELVARAIHRRSPRRDRPFVEVNCAAIPSELIESELFGHMKGSFTGAFADRTGKFEQADGGTLFLDEIGDMSLAAQAKVLRALQEGVITRIGAAKPIKVDVRVIAATNKELAAELAAGRFREDLYYRLNVVPIEVPPLRQRREDIPTLVDRFVNELAQFGGLPPKAFAPDALQELTARDWPGNVRELRNAVERLLILSAGERVVAGDVVRVVAGARDASLGEVAHCETFDEFKTEAEKAFLVGKLEENGWNVSETARRLDMPRSNLYKKIEKYGLARAGGDSGA
ncbi:MAG TPA: sigma-54 dependent transcriptional regulator [Gemmatimonadales bacterium]